jgi:hypothetical protein
MLHIKDMVWFLCCLQHGLGRSEYLSIVGWVLWLGVLVLGRGCLCMEGLFLVDC